MITDSQVNYLLEIFIFYLHLRLAVDFIEEVYVSRDGRFTNKNHRDNVTKCTPYTMYFLQTTVSIKEYVRMHFVYHSYSSLCTFWSYDPLIFWVTLCTCARGKAIDFVYLAVCQHTNRYIWRSRRHSKIQDH